MSLRSSPDGADQPLFEGLFAHLELRPGLFAQLSDLVHTVSAETRFEHLSPCVKIVIRLEGSAHVQMDGRTLPLDCGQGVLAAPAALSVMLRTPTRFERQSSKGSRERMLVLSLQPEWLRSSGLDRIAGLEHLHMRSWQPSEHLVGLVKNLLRIGPSDQPLQRLRMESTVLDIAAEGLAALGDEGQESRETPRERLGLTQFQRACQLRSLLDGGEADHLSMSQISGRIGRNSHTLQVEFRKAFGQTVSEYLRDSRLQRAARAIRFDGVPISRAAEIAGYSSQANFSTAFRKHFGITPKALRPKL